MDFKSVLAGAFLAFGISNLLAAMGIPFSIKLGFTFASFDIGTVILAVASLFIAYYLLKKN